MVCSYLIACQKYNRKSTIHHCCSTSRSTSEVNTTHGYVKSFKYKRHAKETNKNIMKLPTSLVPNNCKQNRKIVTPQKERKKENTNRKTYDIKLKIQIRVIYHPLFNKHRKQLQLEQRTSYKSLFGYKKAPLILNTASHRARSPQCLLAKGNK